jgi:hypothetical protein
MDTLELGRFLREHRETRELTLDDAVSALHIRRAILEAFEQGDFALGGSPVQIRGLLRNYATYLGLDPDQILEYYEAALVYRQRGRGWRRRRRTEEKPLVAPRRITDTPPAMPAVPLVTLADRRAAASPIRGILGSFLTLLVGIGALGVILYVISQMLGAASAEVAPPTATPTATVGVIDPLAPTATFTPSWTPRPFEPTSTPLPAPGSLTGDVRIRIEFRQRTWIRIVVDTVEQFVGVKAPGDVVEYQALEAIEIRAANAAALSILYNGAPQTNYGERGQQVDIRFTPTAAEAQAKPMSLPDSSSSLLTNDAALAGQTAPLDVPVSDTSVLATPLTVPTDALPTLTPFLPPNVTSAPLAATPTLTPFVSSTPNPAELLLTITIPANNLPTPTPILPPSGASNLPTPTLIAPPGATAIPNTPTPILPPNAASTTNTISSTPTALATAAPLGVSPTAVLPLQQTQSGLPPTKAGG